MAQGDGPAPREAGPGEGAGGAHQRDRQEAVAREPCASTGKSGIRRDAEARALRLSDENFWLRHALEVSEHGQKKLTARIAKLRVAKATLSKLPFDEAAQLRTVLRRSRRQKTVIERLRKDNARLRKAVRTAKAGRASAEERLAKLRAVRKTQSTSLSGMDLELRRALRRSRRQKSAIKSRSRENTRFAQTREGGRGTGPRLWKRSLRSCARPGQCCREGLYGRKSEQQKKPRSERKRGQKHGAPGHGRTQRPGSRSAPKYSPRRRRRASAHGADSPMHRTASRESHPRRDRGQGSQAHGPVPALSPDLRVRVLADGSVRAPGGAAAPRHALRNHLLGALALRTLCRPAARCTRIAAWMSARGG